MLVPLNNGTKRSFEPGLQAKFTATWPPVGTVIKLSDDEEIYIRVELGLRIGNVITPGRPKAWCFFGGRGHAEHYTYDAFFFPTPPC